MMIIIPSMKFPLQPLRTALIVLVFAALPHLNSFAADRPAPPGKATDYPAAETHADDHLSVAADPCETRSRCSFFKIDYQKAGFLPVRIIITNDGDSPISLNDARLHFISAAGDKIPAAEPEDVERRQHVNDPTAPKVRLPFPTGHGKSKTSEIEEEMSLFGFNSLVIDGHTTQAGYLFYDIRGLSHPLAGAKLLVRKIRASDGNELFYFEVPFDKYLAAQSK